MNPYIGISKAELKKMVKAKLDKNSIQEAWDIIRHYPVIALGVAVKLNYNTLSKRLLDPGQFTMENVAAFGRYFNVSPRKIYELFSAIEINERLGKVTAEVVYIKKGNGTRGKKSSVA